MVLDLARPPVIQFPARMPRTPRPAKAGLRWSVHPPDGHSEVLRRIQTDHGFISQIMRSSAGPAGVQIVPDSVIEPLAPTARDSPSGAGRPCGLHTPAPYRPGASPVSTHRSRPLSVAAPTTDCAQCCTAALSATPSTHSELRRAGCRSSSAPASRSCRMWCANGATSIPTRPSRTGWC
jgi:hypothetical protein